MLSELKSLILKFRTSLIFTPLLFAIGGLLLSFATVFADQAGFGRSLVKLLPGTGGIDEEGARTVLSTIAAGMFTVTSIVISLTFIALTMMSSQLGPRLLAFFMRDRTTKVSLGIFIATIIYALVSMASVGAKGDATFAPHLSFVIAIFLAIISLGTMIYFVDHIAQSIQADALVARLAAACDDAIDSAIRDEESGEPPTEAEIKALDDRFDETCLKWEAQGTGYLSSVDYPALLKTAAKHDAIIKLFFQVNTFVFDEQVLALFRCPSDQADEMREALDASIALSDRRTPAQQINFEISALSEVALRALSPGINDPYTASACVDYLGNTLSRIAKAAPKVRTLKDEGGTMRLLRTADDLPFFLDQCIAPIIEAGADSPIALTSLIRSLNRIKQVAHAPHDLDAVAKQQAALRELIKGNVKHPSERDRLISMIESDPTSVPPV